MAVSDRWQRNARDEFYFLRRISWAWSVLGEEDINGRLTHTNSFENEPWSGDRIPKGEGVKGRFEPPPDWLSVGRWPIGVFRFPAKAENEDQRVSLCYQMLVRNGRVLSCVFLFTSFIAVARSYLELSNFWYPPSFLFLHSVNCCFYVKGKQKLS